MSASQSTLTIALPPRFDLTRAVCSHGYYMLAPNRWDRDARTLHRPLRGEDDRIILATMTQRGDALRVVCAPALQRHERPKIRDAVVRMLRLDEDFGAWFAMHPQARRRRFARLFRSPTLFEDLVKTMTGCNVTWKNTITMNRLMCEHYSGGGGGGGAFPTPAEVAAVTPAQLKRTCRVGYRAQRIVNLARDFRDGKLTAAQFEDPSLTTDALFDRLRSIHGIGPYAAGNMCQLLGRYDRLAIDSEAYRLYCKLTGTPRPDPRKLHTLHPLIEARYEPYGPYRFLAYWYELWHSDEIVELIAQAEG